MDRRGVASRLDLDWDGAIYQYTLSPLVGHWCKFQPTCSNYFILSVKKHGALGAPRGLWRICRCNPFCKGGFDPP